MGGGGCFDLTEPLFSTSSVPKLHDKELESEVCCCMYFLPLEEGGVFGLPDESSSHHDGLEDLALDGP